MHSVLYFAAYLVAAVVAYSLVGHAIHKWAVAHFTALNELKELGIRRNAKQKLEGTAVICGGSIAGLLAARVCSTHFEDVVVIDPDNDVLVSRAHISLPPFPGGTVDPNISSHLRARVMQTKIIHISQALNLRALDRLFPDFRSWLNTMSATVGPIDGMVYMDGTHVIPPKEYYPDDDIPEIFSMSRGAYETLLRRLVLRIPNVRFMKGSVTGVTPSAGDSGRLESVTYRAGDDLKALSVQKAQLVVDCSGISHAGSTWLKHANFPTPAKEVYNPYMRYYTTEFSVDPTIVSKILPLGFNPSVTFIMVNTNRIDKEKRALAITQIEGNRIHVMTGGWAFKGTTATVAEIRDYASSLRQKHPMPRWVFDLFDYLEGEPEKTSINNVATAGPLYCLKYHDASLKLPHNFVALGDSAMKLNPVFTQGMTKAMIGAMVLNSSLTREFGGISDIFATRFFTSLNNKLASMWNGAKYVDYMLDTTVPAAGETLSNGGALRWFLRNIDELEMAGERDVAWRKLQVVQCIAPPTTLMAPSVLSKIAWHALGQWLAVKELKTTQGSTTLRN